MAMTPHATLKPWRNTMRGAPRKVTTERRPTRPRNTPEARTLDDLTEQLLAGTDTLLAQHEARRRAWHS